VPTVDAVIEEWEFDPQRIDVLQLTGLDPADGDGNLPPGAPISFDLLNSARPRVYDFADGTDTGWTRLLYDDGWTHASWNNGTGDEWDVYDDDGNYVYRAQNQATSLLADIALVYGEGLSDTVARVKWFTGATAGVCGHMNWAGAFHKVTYGIYGLGAEIDSGGLRLVKYNNYGTRTVISTSSFTPVDGTWYWLRLQHVNGDAARVRAKYWTGARLDEPAAWDLAWATASAMYHNEGGRWYCGYGVRCHAGTAYFDDFECFLAPDPAALAKLVVDVGGVECTVENGAIAVRPAVYAETWDTYAAMVPKVNDWHVEVDWSRVSRSTTEPITVVVTYDGLELSSTDFDVTRIPGAWPAYDPATDSPSGDPDRMSWFELESALLVEPLGSFCFFRTIFPLSWGYQDGRYAVALLVWPTSCFEDFVWLLYTAYYTPVDGRYYIGHSVWLDIPVALVAAVPVIGDFPSDTVVRGSKDALFPADIVVQGYRRTDLPASVIPSYQLWWEGAASAVVGQEVIQEFDSSTLVFMRRAGTLVHLRVMSRTTHDRLLAMGVKWTTPVDAVTDEWEWEEHHIAVNQPWYGDDWAYRVKVTVAASKVYADFADLDVLLTETNFPAHFWSNVMSTGADIVVTDATGKVAGKRYRDLIAFDYSGQTMQLRFRGDVDGDTDTDFYVYYGNPSGAETDDTATYGKLANDSNQRIRCYWTMEQNPAGGAPQLTDRSGRGAHATTANMESGDKLASYGDIGYAWDFDGSDEKAETADSALDGVMYWNSWWSAWVKADALTVMGCVAEVMTYQSGYYHQFGIGVAADKKPQAWWYTSSNVFTVLKASAAMSGWVHIAGWFCSADGDVELWVNGVQANYNYGTSIRNTPTRLRGLVGARRTPTLTLTDFFKGQIDEVRWYYWGTGSAVGFPATEVQTRYANESDPATFYSVGTPESKP
jgi:hypothetical protein